MPESDDDEEPRLSAAALAALREVLAERAAGAERARDEAVTAVSGAALASSEDWQLSQFWYSAETSAALADLVVELARAAVATAPRRRRPRVACHACPSTYKALLAKGLVASCGRDDKGGVSGDVSGDVELLDVSILEFDRRFAVFGRDFSFYDYAEPLSLPAELLGACDVIVLDPPFLNAACLAGFATSVSALRRPPPAESRVVLCTGAVMVASARELLRARPTLAHVEHANGRLSNPFAVFVDALPTEVEGHTFLRGYDVDAERLALPSPVAST